MLKLIIEYHYKDGDVGAYKAGEKELSLWKGFAAFSKATAHKPSHIIIRPAKKGE